jgi:hypothetical protein
MISFPPGTKQTDLTALKGEVVSQCWRAEAAWKKLVPLVGSLALSFDQDDPLGRENAAIEHRNEIQDSIQAILSAAGIVSRTLWPPPPPVNRPHHPADRQKVERAKRARARAARIWKAWPLPPEKALKPLKSQSTRNASEHPENDAADWFENGPPGPLSDFQYGRSKSAAGQFGPRYSFRYLFVDTPDLRVKIGTASCSLGQLVASLVRIAQSLSWHVRVASSLRMVPRPRTEPSLRPVECCPLGLTSHRIR